VVLARVRATLADNLLKGDVVARLVAMAGKAENEARADWERSVASAEKAMAGYASRLATARRRLTEAPDDLLEDYQASIRELKEEQATAEADLARLRAEEPVAEEGDARLLGRWLEACRSACEQAQDPGTDGAALNAIFRELVDHVRVTPPLKPRRGNTVGKVEVVLPEWLSRVLSHMAGNSGQHAKSIILTSEAA
jgi:hypothetical protein